ncbi:hypothetical protein D3C86_1277490 [compost metagenome]
MFDAPCDLEPVDHRLDLVAVEARRQRGGVRQQPLEDRASHRGGRRDLRKILALGERHGGHEATTGDGQLVRIETLDRHDAVAPERKARERDRLTLSADGRRLDQRRRDAGPADHDPRLVPCHQVLELTLARKEAAERELKGSLRGARWSRGHRATGAEQRTDTDRC